MDDKGYKHLCGGIVIQAVNDYKHLCKLAMQGDIVESGKHSTKVKYVTEGRKVKCYYLDYSFDEIERFIEEDAELYVDVDATKLLSYLKDMRAKAEWRPR